MPTARYCAGVKECKQFIPTSIANAEWRGLYLYISFVLSLFLSLYIHILINAFHNKFSNACTVREYVYSIYIHIYIYTAILDEFHHPKSPHVAPLVFSLAL